jgi:hypothetical protein
MRFDSVEVTGHDQRRNQRSEYLQDSPTIVEFDFVESILASSKPVGLFRLIPKLACITIEPDEGNLKAMKASSSPLAQETRDEQLSKSTIDSEWSSNTFQLCPD